MKICNGRHKTILCELKNISDIEEFIKKYQILKNFLKIPHHLFEKFQILLKQYDDISYTKAVEKISNQFFGKTAANIQYWIDHGYEGEELKEKYRIRQGLGLRGRGKHPEKYQGIYPNQLQYWIKKGYSEENAKIQVAERQRTFTLEKCIQKYGKEI